MKLNKISNELAEKIIVYAEENKGFNVFTLNDNNYTIHHRVYKNKYYDILEMNTYVEDLDKIVTTFYILDPIEVKQLLGGQINGNK